MSDRREVLQIISQQAVLASTQLKTRKTILVCSRDPGSAKALLPVLKLLQSETNIYCLIDSWAKDIFLQNFETTSLRVSPSALHANAVIPAPDLLLVDPSSSDSSLEDYAVQHFPVAPLVLLEDYYSTVNLALKQFSRFQAEPAKICVMDDFARQIVLEAYPQWHEKIIITGQPAFDAIVNENTAAIRAATRKTLGLAETDRVVTFFSSAHASQALVKKIEQAIAQLNNNKVKLQVYWHLRTNLKNERLAKFTTDQISAASDIVLTTTSVEGLKAIYRDIPTIHILDRRYGGYSTALSADFIPPPCLCGASSAVNQIEVELTPVLAQLLDLKSELATKQHQLRKKYFTPDGKNAERVKQVVKQIIQL